MSDLSNSVTFDIARLRKCFDELEAAFPPAQDTHPDDFGPLADYATKYVHWNQSKDPKDIKRCQTALRNFIDIAEKHPMVSDRSSIPNEPPYESKYGDPSYFKEMQLRYNGTPKSEWPRTKGAQERAFANEISAVAEKITKNHDHYSNKRFKDARLMVALICAKYRVTIGDIDCLGIVSDTDELKLREALGAGFFYFKYDLTKTVLGYTPGVAFVDLSEPADEKSVQKLGKVFEFPKKTTTETKSPL